MDMKFTKPAIGLIAFTVLGVAASGINLIKSDTRGHFQLETVEGDSSALTNFPIEGYGGNENDSFRFSLIDGEVNAKHYGYSEDRMGKILESEALGETGFLKYVYEPAPGGDVFAQAIIIAAEDANTVQEDIADESLERVRNMEYEQGITIRTDKVDVFCETEIERSSQRTGIGSWSVKQDMARFDTGLSMADKEYFFVTGTGENGYYDYDNYYNNYDYSPEGSWYSEDRLTTYRVKIGDEAYVVVAPDERCEGQTYVFKVSAYYGDHLFAAKDNFWDTVHYRDMVGKAEPIIPVPEFKDGRVIGLDEIEEKGLLLLHTIRGNKAYTDVYDTKGVFLGGGEVELNGESYAYAEANIIHWEDGISVDIRMKEDYDADKVAGKILLWIDKDNHIQQIVRDDQMDQAIVRNDLVLYLHSNTEEELPVIGIMGCPMIGVDYVKVCDRENGQVLFEGNFVVR